MYPPPDLRRLIKAGEPGSAAFTIAISRKSADAKALLYPEDKRRELILKLIRDSSAFHLDKNDKVTSMVLKDLDLSVIDLYSSDWGTYSDFCCDMADTVDLNHWIHAFRDDKSEKETFREIIGRYRRHIGSNPKSSLRNYSEVGHKAGLNTKVIEDGRN